MVLVAIKTTEGNEVFSFRNIHDAKAFCRDMSQRGVDWAISQSINTTKAGGTKAQWVHDEKALAPHRRKKA